MSYETIFSIKNCEKETILRKGKTAEFSFYTPNLNTEKKHSLFFTCEDKKFYQYKREGKNDVLYMLIDDSLNSEQACENHFCLDMSCKSPFLYVKRAAYKQMWTTDGIIEGETDENYTFGISAKASGLHVSENGYLRLRLDVWNNGDRVNSLPEPDYSYVIDIPEGDYDYKDFNLPVNIKNETTHSVMLTIEGLLYEGNVYFERPHLTTEKGTNAVCHFDITSATSPEFNWCGQNLSKREWPTFKIAINGTVFYDDEVFLRMQRYTPIEIAIPRGLLLSGNNTLSITYTSDYFSTIPVGINEIKLIETPYSSFNIVHCPDYVVAGKPLQILLETNCEDITLNLDSNHFKAISPLNFKGAGYHTISLLPLVEKNGMEFTFSFENTKESRKISYCVRRGDDSIMCGCGDMIYINNSNEKEVCDYIAWFTREELGKLLTIRPVYHWGGGRILNPRVWQELKRLAEGLGLSYVLMSDGRDLPGIAKNPSNKELSGSNYLGKQTHERDGQLFYWPLRPIDTIPLTPAFFDLAARESRENPEHGEVNYNPNNLMDVDNMVSLKRIQVDTPDLKKAYKIASNELNDFATKSTRHTGPSVMYKYLYENGFNFLGAETMDSALEPQLAFLRGASKAYEKNKMGIHHALQWSTTPHDNEKRYRRFMLANYLSYMHGATDINTEEGFFFFEHGYSYHNRLSKATTRHRDVQKIFSKYIATHTRTGTFYTKTAFLHGRYDGWNGLTRQYLFGMKCMENSEVEDSWALLKAFYPLCKIDRNGLERVGYTPGDIDHPVGYFSGTPRGNVDVIPVENGKFNDYSLLVFAGYNSACQKDLDRLMSFVSLGGTLMLTFAHLSSTTNYNDIISKKFSPIKHKLTSCLSVGEPQFVSDTINGKKVMVCNNLATNCEVINKTDNSRPLLVKIPVGNGNIVLCNALSYPGDKAIFDIYNQELCYLNKQIQDNEGSELICDVNVGYTIYKVNENEKHYYLTPVDWYNDSTADRTATLRLGKTKYPLSVKFGNITKIIEIGSIAAWVNEMGAEIIKLTENLIIVQGHGSATLNIAKNGVVTTHTLEFGENPVVELSI